MGAASESRKRAQEWLDRAERLPPKQRQAALAIAEAWFQAAMDAAPKELYARRQVLRCHSAIAKHELTA